MGVTQTPTHQLVQQIIHETEIPLRNQSHQTHAIHDVFRFGAPVGSTIKQYAALGRGMDLARDMVRQAEEEGVSFPSGTVIIADRLTSGKGRFTRGWHAPAGGLWMTLVLVNTLLPETSRLYPLAAGVACCEAVRHYGIDARIKWVNDVHAAGRKVCGILTESMIGPLHGEEYILIGAGINVNNREFPSELSSSAGSMADILGHEIDLHLFAARLLAKFAWNIGLLHFEEHRLLERQGTGELEESEGHLLLDRFRKLTDSIGRRVRFGFNVQDEPQFDARTTAMLNSGGLELRLDDGSVIVEHSGEIVYLDQEG